MCGIVGYIGHKQAYPILINGLKRLEYRGYDSAGISILNGEVKTFKRKGKVSDLEDFVKGKDIKGCIGIGHTRWATHGEPNDVNAHPHTSMNGHFTLIHNGIIENYKELKEELGNSGHVFSSQTDSEVIAHLVHSHYGGDLLDAVQKTVAEMVGAFAIAVVSVREPNRLVGAKNPTTLHSAAISRP